MFETESGFAETKMLINCKGDYSKKLDYKKGWQDGAEFGYNKAKEDVKDIIVRLIENHPDTYSGADIEFNQKRMFKFSKAVSDAQDYLKEVL